ncbi:MAG: cytochrome P450, partial [Acidimicrobiales bacterium]
MLEKILALLRLAFRRGTRIAVAPQEAWHVLRNDDIKRSHPRYRRWVLWVFVLELASLTVLAIIAPFLLMPAGVALIAIAGFYGWRARPRWGHRRGLPPGSVGVGTKPISDPGHYRNGFVTHGSTFKSNYLDLPMVCVEGIERGTRLLTEHQDHLRPAASPWNRFIPDGLVRWMDGDVHDEYRRILAGALGARLVTAVQPALDDGVARALSRMADVCREDISGAVQPFEHIHDMMFSIWADVFFGFRSSDRQTEEVHALYGIISLEEQALGSRVLPALDRLEMLIRDQHVRNTTGDEPRLTLLTEIERRQADALERPTTIRNLIYLMESSGNDVTGLLNWVLKHAVDHPDYLRELRNSAAESGPKSLAHRMVAETLRLEQSEELGRVVSESFTFEGHLMPAEWAVRVRVHESHRDPSIFEQPDRYNPDRFLRTYSTAEYA